MFWFLKRGVRDSSKKFDNLTNSIKDSFGNVKKDIDYLTRLFHNASVKLEESEQQHGNHQERFEQVIQRLEKLELVLLNKNNKYKELRVDTFKVSTSNADKERWETLTNIQRLIYFKLTSLQKENPNTWISFKEFVREVYPDKDYKSIKSVISEYTDVLEEMGYLRKKRKGRKTYLKSTGKNPYAKKEEQKRIKEKKKKPLEIKKERSQ